MFASNFDVAANANGLDIVICVTLYEYLCSIFWPAKFEYSIQSSKYIFSYVIANIMWCGDSIHERIVLIQIPVIIINITRSTRGAK